MLGCPLLVCAVNLDDLQLDVATKKVQQQVKQLANKGDVNNARILAREVVRSHKQKDRLSVSKARLGSINHQLQQQLGTVLRISMGSPGTHCYKKRWPRLQELCRSRLRS